MLFQKRNKDDDIRNLKNAINTPAEIDDTSELMPELEPEPEEIAIAPDRRDAPLFVKVEKYRDLLSLIQEMKVFISGIKQLFGIIEELENLRVDSVKIMKATMQRLERRVVEIDSELLRPRGFETPEMQHSEPEISNVEDSLTELQKEIAKLRGELEDLK